CISRDVLSLLVYANTSAMKCLFASVQKGMEANLKYTNLILSGTSLARLAYVLLLLCNEQDVVTVPKEEMAHMAGFRRETVSRLLAKLKSRNLIELGHREVKILNKEELALMD
ncbi:MAG TPA: helix-turn-helix domain-containing protein, partial [Bacteroidia bacterium]|nr:helix-turn-helix domain-containing protein [Bacteroidia bacterium]